LRIYAVIRRIPRGRVATYGQVAFLAGLPGHARQVGHALRALSDAHGVPWHRVLNAAGRISPRADAAWTTVQRHMLEGEGVRFDAAGRVSLPRYGWNKGGLAPVHGRRYDPATHPTTAMRESMGKGDRKSRKGKIWRGSFGNRRPRKKNRKNKGNKSQEAPAR
jgi:methylated-DNA-protein-cysteine methyltransferase-like protein